MQRTGICPDFLCLKLGVHPRQSHLLPKICHLALASPKIPSTVQLNNMIWYREKKESAKVVRNKTAVTTSCDRIAISLFLETTSAHA